MKLITNSILLLVYYFVISWIIADESGNTVKLYTKIEFVINNIVHTNSK